MIHISGLCYKVGGGRSFEGGCSFVRLGISGLCY